MHEGSWMGVPMRGSEGEWIVTMTRAGATCRQDSLILVYHGSLPMLLCVTQLVETVVGLP